MKKCFVGRRGGALVRGSEHAAGIQRIAIERGRDLVIKPVDSRG